MDDAETTTSDGAFHILAAAKAKARATIADSLKGGNTIKTNGIELLMNKGWRWHERHLHLSDKDHFTTHNTLS